MSDKEIALQITLKTLEKTEFKSTEETKTLPYEIYNSIYKNIDKQRYI